MSLRIKLISAILLPIVIGSILIATAIYSNARAELDARTLHFGDAIADQLALTVTDPLMQEDVLSVNVILNELYKRGDVAFASVYKSDNSLMAQAGRASDGDLVFSEDITFQNSTSGYVQLGISKNEAMAPLSGVFLLAISIDLAFIGVIGIIIWFYADLFYLWLSPAARIRPSREPEVPAIDDVVEAEDAPSFQHTVLVIKIRPARHLDIHRERILAALELHGGTLELTDGDDVIMTFSGSEQLMKAACSAELIRALMHRTRGNITVKFGLHCYEADDERSEIDKARKHATYLASISDNQVLASRVVFAAATGESRVSFDEFHSSLTPDGEVYSLASLGEASVALIEKQVDQLIR